MSKKPTPEPDDKDQSERFKKMARELGADETGAEFEKAIPRAVPKRKVVTLNPKKKL